MIKECNNCFNLSSFKSGKYELKELIKWIGSVDDIENKAASYLKNNKRHSLFRCKNCGSFWEWRSLFEETMYGGEPGEWIKVSHKYVEEYYPNVIVENSKPHKKLK